MGCVNARLAEEWQSASVIPVEHNRQGTHSLSAPVATKQQLQTAHQLHANIAVSLKAKRNLQWFSTAHGNLVALYAGRCCRQLGKGFCQA
jgi:hypothetical protein